MSDRDIGAALRAARAVLSTEQLTQAYSGVHPAPTTKSGPPPDVGQSAAAYGLPPPAPSVKESIAADVNTYVAPVVQEIQKKVEGVQEVAGEVMDYFTAYSTPPGRVVKYVKEHPNPVVSWIYDHVTIRPDPLSIVPTSAKVGYKFLTDVGGNVVESASSGKPLPLQQALGPYLAYADVLRPGSAKVIGGAVAGLVPEGDERMILSDLALMGSEALSAFGAVQAAGSILGAAIAPYAPAVANLIGKIGTVAVPGLAAYLGGKAGARPLAEAIPAAITEGMGKQDVTVNVTMPSPVTPDEGPPESELPPSVVPPAQKPFVPFSEMPDSGFKWIPKVVDQVIGGGDEGGDTDKGTSGIGAITSALETGLAAGLGRGLIEQYLKSDPGISVVHGGGGAPFASGFAKKKKKKKEKKYNSQKGRTPGKVVSMSSRIEKATSERGKLTQG
jgi:hypothetical protein